MKCVDYPELSRKRVFVRMTCVAPKHVAGLCLCLFGITFLSVAESRGEGTDTGNRPKKNQYHIAEKGYILAASHVFSTLADRNHSSADLQEKYSAMRRVWLQVNLQPDSSAPYDRQIQTVWSKDLPAPAPGVALASWILMLEHANFGIIGTKRLSGFMAGAVGKNNGIVLCETENKLVWATQVKYSRRNTVLHLSDGTKVECGNDRKGEFCSCSNARQWIVILPTHEAVCPFLRHMRGHSRGARVRPFWYPGFMVDYVVSTTGKKNAHELLQIKHSGPCDN